MLKNLIVLFTMPLTAFTQDSFIHHSVNYFPQSVGNVWQFKYQEADSIFAAPEQIFAATVIDDTLYYKFGSDIVYSFFIRADSLGRIWRRIDHHEVLWLDFSLADGDQYQYQPFADGILYTVTVATGVSIQTFAGRFNNCIEFFFNDPHSFDEEQWFTFAPAIGMVRKQDASVSMLLASAKINGRLLGLPLLEHYPTQDGNAWDYTGGFTELGIFFPSLYFKSVIGDSVYTDGKRYKVIQTLACNMRYPQNPGALGNISSSMILQRIDGSTLNVYQINDRSQITPFLIDSLNADIGDEFQMRPGEGDNILSLTDTMTIDLFGKMRKLRHLTIINPLVGFSFATLEGIGDYSWSSGGEGSPSSKRIAGCVINGDTLGTLLRTQPPGLKVNLNELDFSRDVKSQILVMSNPNEGLAIIDSVNVNNEEDFYSNPGYRNGSFGNSFFSKGPFYIFPHDSIWLEISIRDDLTDGNFTDTLSIYAHGINGTPLPSILLPVSVGDVSVHSVNDQRPLTFSCSQNYPNPFNSETTIEFTVPDEKRVSLKIYNMLGSEILELLNKKLKPGIYKIQFEARDLPSGIYFYQVQSGTSRAMKKCLLIK